MDEKTILKSIQTSVIAAVTASTMPTLPIKVVGITFEVPSDQKYLEVISIPNNPNDRYYGSEKIYRGFFRLILHWPVSGKGAYEPIDLVENIAKYFVKGSYYGGVKIEGIPNFSGMLETGADLIFPVSIPYQVFAP